MWMITMRHAESLWNARRKGKQLIEDPNKPYASLTDASVHLTKEGWEQVDRASEFLENLFSIYSQKGAVKVTSSPQVRAEETASGVVKAIRNAGIELVKSRQTQHEFFESTTLLGERSFGEWADMTPKEVAEYYERRARLAQLSLQGKKGVTKADLEFARKDAMRDYDYFVKHKKDPLTKGLYAKAPKGEAPIDLMTGRLKTYSGAIVRQVARKVERHINVAHGEVGKLLPLTFLKKHPYDYAKCENPGNTAMSLITGDGNGGYIDFGYIYDPDRGIDITKQKRSKELEKHFY